MDRKTTILVVEDDIDHQNLIKLVLAKLSHVHVDTAVTGEAAQMYLRAEDPPALIVLDHWLPDISGLDLLEWLAGDEQLASVPVIMLTGSEDPKHARQAYALGVRRYLIKPADFNELVVAIKETLGDWVESEPDSALG